ncbi:MAG: transaldolase [Actinomycetales bacterium]|nr:transaldolase [Actinomycetales bacterium]
MNDALARLRAHRVAVWLDDLSRELIQTGDLATLVGDRGVVGVTTNPTIFASAVSAGDRYDDDLRTLARAGATVDAAVLRLTTDDVRAACDVLRPVHDETGGLDGRVSIEVDPRLAHDTAATVEAARTLWSRVDRPNLLVKIPATVAGLPAITTALSEGISVNVTLIFGLGRYREVVNAFMCGLEDAVAAGRDVSGIASVASFFVSRVDTEVDRRLDDLGTEQAAALRGLAAIANARLAYQAYEEAFATPRWQVLADSGARRQRPLWASTGVKDPRYPDTRYVTELVAPDTVNTMPLTTLDAVVDHGQVEGDTVRDRYAESAAVLDDLERSGISYDDVIATLEREGVEKFQQSWSDLTATVTGQLAALGGEAAPATPSAEEAR